MSLDRIECLVRLKEQLQNLPGIGPRSAERIAFHLLRESRDSAAALAQAILDVKDRIRHCARCFNLTETDPCAICADARREVGEVWVVEQPHDVAVLESTGLVRGTYHVLMGHLSPLEGIEPEDLTIQPLIDRVAAGGIHEIVLALNPTMEGDGTALQLQNLLGKFQVTITRPARGLAVGSQLEYASVGMLESAIRGRTKM